jgi:lipopolysaccharide transport system ATP-binding protein
MTMFQKQKIKKEGNAIVVEHVSKVFKIPHERRRTVFENVAGLVKGNRYSYEEFWALQNISFTVKRGETLGVIGENGSGKSTLLKVIAGVLFPDRGKVTVDGKIAPFLELGVGFQPELTADDNVYIYGSIMGLNRTQIKNKINDIFEFAELEKFRNAKLKNFSSGMYARLAFSTAISTDPEIILIDEALAVGDEAFQRKCYEKINEFRRNEKTIIFVSHGLGTVKQLCERSILLSHGQIDSIGYSEKVVNDYHIGINAKEELKIKELQEKRIERTEENRVNIEPMQEQKNVDTENIDQKLSNRWGSHEIKILEVKFFDKNGTERYFFTTGETLTVQLRYYAKKPIENPTFGVAIFSSDGTYVYGSNTHVDNLSFGTVVGEGIVALTYDNLSLLTGTFLIDVAIYDTLASTTYEYIKHNYSFKVQDSSGNEGLCKMPHNYKILKLPDHANTVAGSPYDI